MKIAVITTGELKGELLEQGVQDGIEVHWLAAPGFIEGADCYIDLLFEKKQARIDTLKKLEPALIIVNDVTATPGELPPTFTRINGWPSFLKRQLVEAAAGGNTEKERAGKIFASLGKKIEWVPDTAGFVSARVISMIINEAYFTLAENVSSKEEIDIAMKLGTNYPFGPFEWAQKIGLKNVYALLETLSKTNSRYQPAALLKKEALTR